MLFNSLEYFLLLTATCFLYWITPNVNARRGLLFLSSLLFYASWSVPFIALLLAVVTLNWAAANLLDKYPKKTVTSVSVILTLAVLAYFKYANFFTANFDNLMSFMGMEQTRTHFQLILPLGISFYVFQVMAYTIDVARGRIKKENSLFSLTLFIIFFPQLIAGPICRTTELMPQLKKLQDFKWTNITGGLALVSAGLFLKVTFADGLAIFVDKIFNDPQSFSGADNLYAVLGYGVQIFCDFWGYSTMAVGSALLFGYEIPVNFKLPYSARSLRQFWQRWHITLSQWLRDYLYITMGGSRTSPMKIYRNLTITMVLGGLWHGASWNFVIWGAIHGGFLAIERMITNRLNSWNFTVSKKLSFAWDAGKWLYTMFVVFLAWIFFRAPNFKSAIYVIQKIGTDTSLSVEGLPHSFLLILIIFALGHLPIYWFIHKIYDENKINACSRLTASLWLMILSLIFSSGETQKFIYFEF